MKIGIIHTAFIGDVVLTGLLIEGLYQSGHEIIFFTKAKTSAILQNDSRVSKIITLNKPTGFRKIFAFKSMVSQIQGEALDVLICPHRSLTTTLCAYFSKVKMTVGFKNATLAFLYTQRKPYLAQMHECVKYLNLIPAAVCPPDIFKSVQQVGRPILRLSPSQVFKGSANHVVDGRSAETSPYFVLAIGSMWNTKKYPRDYFVEVCRDILNTHPTLMCYLTGDKNDAHVCQTFAENLSEFAPRILNTAGKSTLTEFVNILAHSKFIVCNDSSPLHFSSALNIPVICFWGPTSAENGFGPVANKRLVISHKTLFGQNLACQPCGTHGAKTCPKKHHLCMKKMTPKLVNKKIRQFLHSMNLS